MAAVVLMVKNEARRIEYTIKSCNDKYINGIIVYDTGSTDDTIAIIEREATVPVHVKRGEFVDFAVSRNACLKFANECAREHGYDFFFLLDANDELVFDENFVLPTEEKHGAWMVECYWNIHDDTDYMSFKNTKFIRSNVYDMRWVGVVHEYLDTRAYSRGELRGVRVFQDRVKDNDGKSRERWERDRILLEAEHVRDPENGRTLFYLAQTYSCIGQPQLAYDTYKKRAAIDGFMEEKYVATCRCGENAEILKLGDYTAIEWYLKAAALDPDRAEPFVAISRIYTRLKQYRLAHAFAKMACDMPFPFSALLFVDRDCYTYGRWHQLGLVSYYAKEYDDGRRGCIEAIRVRNKDIDKFNLKFYMD